MGFIKLLLIGGPTIISQLYQSISRICSHFDGQILHFHLGVVPLGLRTLSDSRGTDSRDAKMATDEAEQS